MIKEFGNNYRNSMVIKFGTALVLVLVLTMVVFFISYSDNVSKELADNLIRFHVIANSDSAEDQVLKREVRDVVINYMREQLKDSKDVEQTKYIINMNINKIEALAKNEIVKRGKNYTVKTMLGSYPFPTKLYGDITLPAGYYQALRIVIGNGEGANWWCVLFPPLCFVDVTHGTIPDSVKENLRNALTDEEYGIITSSYEKNDVPIKIKFKIVEIFQDTKIKFSGMLNRLFKSMQ